MLTKKERAINALAREIDTWKDETIDDFIRPVLDIEPRPEDSEPFGWLLPQTNKDNPTGISDVGIDLIKKWEGFRSRAYLDPVGVWTIGYGHTKGVKRGQMITEPEALALLKEEVKTYANAVKEKVTVELNQNQFDALTSFTYNVGIGALSNSTLLKRLNKEQYTAAAEQLLRWVKGDGRTLPGLVNRRQEERELFLK